MDERLTKNFKLSEFKCRNGENIPSALVPNVRKLAKSLQVLRNEINLPICINSAYRTPVYNKSVGGTAKSQHIKATAADIRVPDMTPLVVGTLINKLIEENKMIEGGIGIYSTFLHYDVRGYKARW